PAEPERHDAEVNKGGWASFKSPTRGIRGVGTLSSMPIPAMRCLAEQALNGNLNSSVAPPPPGAKDYSEQTAASIDARPSPLVNDGECSEAPPHQCIWLKSPKSDADKRFR